MPAAPALDHRHGTVLGQVEVGCKTNEIPLFSTLLDDIDLTRSVATADALHAQRDHTEYLVAQRGAHYLLTVKRTSRPCTPSSQSAVATGPRRRPAPRTRPRPRRDPRAQGHRDRWPQRGTGLPARRPSLADQAATSTDLQSREEVVQRDRLRGDLPGCLASRRPPTRLNHAASKRWSTTDNRTSADPGFPQS
jgi:hypothetical protein